MICFKEEVIITQDDKWKDFYIKTLSAGNGWKRSDTTQLTTLKRERWIKLKGEPPYNDDLYEDWMMFDKGETE